MLALIWAFLGTGIGRIVGGALAAAVLMIGIQAFQAFTEWRVSRAYAKGVGIVVEAVKRRDATVAELEKRAERDAAEIDAMRQRIEEEARHVVGAAGAAAAGTGGGDAPAVAVGTEVGGPAAADGWSARLDRVLDAARAPKR